MSFFKRIDSNDVLTVAGFLLMIAAAVLFDWRLAIFVTGGFMTILGLLGAAAKEG